MKTANKSIQEVISVLECTNQIYGEGGYPIHIELYKLIDGLSDADNEITFLHECITELYNASDENIPIIKKYLSKINEIYENRN